MPLHICEALNKLKPHTILFHKTLFSTLKINFEWKLNFHPNKKFPFSNPQKHYESNKK